MDAVLNEASRLLDAGYPASALVELKDTYATAPFCFFRDLAPLWQRAYTDLGRPTLADYLGLMADDYSATGCWHPDQHTHPDTLTDL